MIYKNALITTKDEQFLGWLEVDDNNLLVSINKGITNKEGYDCNQNILMPGFIDSHTHGGSNFSFDHLEDTKEKYLLYLENLKKEGVVAFLGASVTSSLSKLKKSLININEYLNENLTSLPKMVGWYFEGPFISKEKKGAHEECLIIPLNEDFLQDIKTNICDKPIVITVDSEKEENLHLINKYKNEFIFALGHSNSTYNKAKDALFNGIKRITHLYNAMSGFGHSNNMGIINVLFNKEFNNDLNIELIADGVHVSNEVIEYTYNNFNIDNISIVSDSLPPKGLEDGFYKLGNLDIEKKGNWCYLKGTKTLAGSTMPYNLVLKNFKNATNCSWNEIVKVSSYNCARNLNLDLNFGDFVQGKKTNFVLMDKDFNIVYVVI